jgi:hypothetical protein
VDIDGDGHDEIWIHSDRFSALLSPRRGGAIEEYTVFAGGINFANTLTRRREAYHDTALEQQANTPASGEGGTPSIHDIEEGLRLEQRPPLDADPRALFVDRVLPGGLALDQYVGGDFWPVRTWAQTHCSYAIERERDRVEVVCSFPGPSGEAKPLEKRIAFVADGGLTVTYRWDRSIGQPGDVFAPELSLSSPLELRAEPPTEIWRFPIETVAKSEHGLERTRQGDSVTLRWPVHLGEASVEVEPAVQAEVARAAFSEEAD